MSLKNTEHDYGSLAKVLHWIVAALFVYLFYIAINMTGMENGAEKWGLYAEHKQFGVLAFIFICVRVFIKLTNPSPALPDTIPNWQTTASKVMHTALYVIMIAFPVSGMLMSMAGNYPIIFFGFELPNLVGENKSLGEAMHAIHEALMCVTYGVVGIHVAAALMHLAKRDGVFSRMLPTKSK